LPKLYVAFSLLLEDKKKRKKKLGFSLYFAENPVSLSALAKSMCCSLSPLAENKKKKKKSLSLTHSLYFSV